MGVRGRRRSRARGDGLRLARHVAAGELAPCDLRHAALALLGPLLLALLHQGPLGGRVCGPLDLDAFAATHQSIERRC
ncbi:hypothetical protein WMF37_08890 [Sorangium sp. So ce291]|uniref:hypothetical protein n=1 Tax=Sorangium sp. So ce291 TaxID=3133294 RepID=UPI003F5ED87E